MVARRRVALASQFAGGPDQRGRLSLLPQGRSLRLRFYRCSGVRLSPQWTTTRPAPIRAGSEQSRAARRVGGAVRPWRAVRRVVRLGHAARRAYASLPCWGAVRAGVTAAARPKAKPRHGSSMRARPLPVKSSRRTDQPGAVAARSDGPRAPRNSSRVTKVSPRGSGATEPIWGAVNAHERCR